MNKGLKIWSKKRAKRRSQAMTKKPEQIGLVRFIDFKDIVHHKVNGHFTNEPSHPNRHGLQIENKFYYVSNNQLKAVMVNKRCAKVLKIYDSIPEWAEQLLIEKYNLAIKKFSI